MTNHMGCLRQNARMILDGISICASATVMRPRSRHSSRILSESSDSSGSSAASKHSVSMFFFKAALLLLLSCHQAMDVQDKLTPIVLL